MGKEKLLVSSCLLGELVKYNGSHNGFDIKIIESLKQKYEVFSFCPEVEGGLPTPRVPCEIIAKDPIKVIDKEGNDKTKEFILGAKKTLEHCKKHNISKALMKANSPSCSNQFVKDGTFSGISVAGYGITVELLMKNNIEVFNEKQIEKLIY